jgi:hypothetical protein
MGRCDSLPSISPRFECFAGRYHRFAPGSSPPARDKKAVDHPGVGKPELQPAVTMEMTRSPKSPWNPFDHSPMLFDPGRIRQAERTMSKLPDAAPACVHDEGSLRLVFSGLSHTAFDLAVYASQDGSPHHHARLASRLLAQFYRTGLVTRRVPIKGFTSEMILLFRVCLAQGHHTQLSTR